MVASELNLNHDRFENIIYYLNYSAGYREFGH